MKRKNNIKSKAKGKAKGKSKDSVIIHNENKVVIHTPKARRTYRRKLTSAPHSNYTQPNYPIVTYFNQEPPRKETQNELLKMAENYISPPQIMNTENQEEENNIRHIENIPPKSKPFKIKSITEQIYRKPSTKFIDVDDPGQLKKLGVRQLKEIGKVKGVPNDLLKQINSKSKDMMIDELFKNKKSTTNNSNEEHQSTPIIKMSAKPKKPDTDDELNNLISSIDTNTPTIAKAGGTVIVSSQKHKKSDKQIKKEVGRVLNDMITKVESSETPTERKASAKAKKST
jgi:uncharacterized membrane-anchored protein YjiN (DUF445 family)